MSESRDVTAAIPPPAPPPEPVPPSERTDHRVLLALQGLVVGFPLLLGGRPRWTLLVACPVIMVLLVITLRERRRRGAQGAAGVGLLAGFVALALGTTLPLPPHWLRLLSPATAQLYADMLPGWPGEGGWSTWRPLALDPYAVWIEVLRFSIGFGAFAVLVAYPWHTVSGDPASRRRVFGRLLLTLIAAGGVLAALALAQEGFGNGEILWVSGVPATSGRASGPFVNANHFAGLLEMVIPVALVYVVAIVARVRKRLTYAAEIGRGIGVRWRRAWAAAFMIHQRRLLPPLVAASAVATMGLAHAATGSRGGTAALIAGLGVAGTGVAFGSRRKGSRRGRWLPAAIGLGVIVVSSGSLALWAGADGEQQAVEGADVNLAKRLVASRQGSRIVFDFPLFGTGLGTWRHVFPRYQAPPIEGGLIWDHAHNDYLELASESGVAGLVLAILFLVAVVSAARRTGRIRSQGKAGQKARRPAVVQPAAFRPPEWREALEERTVLRWGLAGGVVALLVHSFVDFGLRMPANLLTLMFVLGLLVLSGRRETRAHGSSLALGLLPALIAMAATPPVLNRFLVAAGAAPLSPGDCLAEADLLLAEEGDAGAERALALVRRALDRAPANRPAHGALAAALGPGEAGEEALQRTIALAPWAVESRDELAFRLLARGELRAGTVELSESMFRSPYLVSHGYLDPRSSPITDDPRRLIRAIVDGDTMMARLTALAPEVVTAIERGLRHALRDVPKGGNRAAIADDLITLLEAHERWDEAADTLVAETRADPARVARAQLKASNEAAAEQTLLTALLRTPEEGEIYRQLAVDIYARRGDFPSAEDVLAAGERNALNVLPIYQGLTEVLARRESARVESFGRPSEPVAGAKAGAR